MKEIRIINASPLKGEEIVREIERASLPFKITLCEKPLLPEPGEKTALALASARYGYEKMPATVKKNLVCIEKRLLKENKAPGGVIYDGIEFQKILSDTFKSQAGSGRLLACLTTRVLATPEAEGALPHIRMLIGGNPSAISLRGIVQGPAKGLRQAGDEEKFEEMSGIEDKRIPAITASLVVQAAFYYFLGQAFCFSSLCRLFNPHYRKDMLKALGPGASLCRFHAGMVEKPGEE